jgi:transposase
MTLKPGFKVNPTSSLRTWNASCSLSILAAKNKVDNTNGWLTNLLKRRHPNIAAVALANKNVRTVWAMLAHGSEFKADYVPTRMAA